MCRYQYESEGYRTYGDNIPGFAQGAYFPGDEPGLYCRLTGESCDNPDGDAPMDCAANTPTAICCPACKDDLITLWWSRENGMCFCLECGGEWARGQMPDEILSLHPLGVAV